VAAAFFSTSSRRLAFAWLLGRVIALGAMVGGVHWPAPHLREGHLNAAGSAVLQSETLAVDVWNRWDSQFYNALANQGYPKARDDGGWVYHAAYYPLFPVLMRGVSELTRWPTFVTGLLLSQLAWIAGLFYFYRLLRLDHSADVSERAVMCLLAYPGSHFMGAVYPDALALFLSVFAVYAARQRLAFVAGASWALACVTRSSGPLLVFPVLLGLWSAEGQKPSLRFLWLLLPAVPIAAWLGLNQQLYGSWFYFMRVQEGWGRHAANPLLALFQVKDSIDYNLIALATLMLLVVGLRRPNRLGERLFAVCAALLPLSTGILRGVHRYTASNFPLFLYGAQALERWPKVRKTLWLLGYLAMGVYAFQWGKGQLPN
jgi:hypothetical protein